jgi:hypothetical protein
MILKKYKLPSELYQPTLDQLDELATHWHALAEIYSRFGNTQMENQCLHMARGYEEDLVFKKQQEEAEESER